MESTAEVQGTPLKIVTQPKSVTVLNGETAKTTVKAEGDGLTYQWYLKTATATKFTKSSVKKSTYSVTMSDSVNGRQLYCVVTDTYGDSIKTQTVTLKKKTPLVITAQPKSVTVNGGEKAVVTIEAEGDGLSYQWYLKNASASKFSKSSVQNSTYRVTMSDTVNGRQIYCVVTDTYGNTVKTNTATLIQKTKSESIPIIDTDVSEPFSGMCCWGFVESISPMYRTLSKESMKFAGKHA